MQQTQETKNVPIHIKVAYGTDFRRFLLNPITFVQLETMLKTLFNLATEFRVKFKDDEGDWVLITTDQELVYATELSGSPLRLEIHVSSTSVAEVDACPEFTEARPGRGRRGGRGRGAGRGCATSHEERLSKKSSRLTERINQLETKLSSETLSSDRERVIRWRLSNLKEKFEFVQTKKASLDSVLNPSSDDQTSPVELAEPSLSVPEQEIEKPSGRGGCRRGRGGGRGGMRRAMGEEGDRPRKCRKNLISPETMAAFRQAKINLRDARDSGDAEKIKACMEAFQAAKEAKFQEARAAKCAEETEEVKA